MVLYHRIENTEATTEKTEIGRMKFGTESRGEGRWSKGLECWELRINRGVRSGRISYSPDSKWSRSTKWFSTSVGSSLRGCCQRLHDISKLCGCVWLCVCAGVRGHAYVCFNSPNRILVGKPLGAFEEILI